MFHTRSRRRRRAAIVKVTAASLIAAVVAGCGTDADDGSPSGDSAGQVRLVDVPGGGLAMYPQIVAAMSQGFFKEEGVEVERTSSSTSGDAVQLLITGNTDIATVTPDVAIQAVQKGADLVAIAATSTEAPYYLESKVEYSDIKQFAGKKLGVPQLTGTATFLAKVALGKAGLEPGSYQLIVTGQASQRLAALTRGAVDATMLPAPLNLSAEAQGFHRLLYLGDAIDAPGAVLLARRDFVEKNRDLTVNFLRAFLKARTWLYDQSNRSAFLSAVANDPMGKGLSESALQQTYDEFVSKRAINPAVGEVELSSLAQTMVDYDELSSLPDVSRMVDNAYIKEASR
jgi:NitT/TauT family transport system substrate-binding protein